MSADALITRHRPTSWPDVVGHRAELRAVRDAVTNRSAHCFLLTGKPGIGKSTFASLIAKELGAEDPVQIPAAVYTSVDDMRDLIRNLRYAPLDGEVRVLIIDECFSPDTLVDTPTGPQKISSLREGDFVNGAQGAAPIKKVFRTKVPTSRIVYIRLSSGRVIKCSRWHPFLTTNGWKEACYLEGETLVQNVSSSLLGMWDSIYFAKYGHPVLHELPPKIVHSTMSCVWDQFFGTQHGIFSTNVFQGLWGSNSWNEANGGSVSGTSAKIIRSRSSIPSSRSREMEKTGSGSGGAYATKQPQFPAGSARANTQYQASSGDIQCMVWDSWGEWYSESPGNYVGEVDQRQTKFSSCYRDSRETVQGAALLQGRHSATRRAFSNRIGWPNSLRRQSSGSGHQKGDCIAEIRVERVEVQESGIGCGLPISGGDNLRESVEFEEFYDLEIDGHPSYKVDGNIVHNCHRLSAQAFDALLIDIENPPDWVFWIFCTTNPIKIPQSIKRRCLSIQLKEVTDNELWDLLPKVAEEEGIECDDDILSVCIKEADGSPGQALANLAVCAAAADRAEAAKLLRSAQAEPEVVELVRLLLRGAEWEQLQPLLKKLVNAEPESIRRVTLDYLTKVILDTENPEQAVKVASMLEAFSSISYSFSDIVLSVCKVVFAHTD